MLHAVTCLFNPCGYRRLVENHRTFAAGLADAGVPLTTVELSFDGRFEVPGSVRLVGDPAVHTLWQKERLLNLAVESLPPEVDKVAWVDADLLFLNRSWAAETERVLETHAVCQPFRRAHLTDAAGRLGGSRRSIGQALAEGETPTWKDHCGFAWAARRELIAAGGPGGGGLYDRHVVGGGDRAMADAWLGRPAPDGPQKRAPKWWADYLAWAEPQAAAAGGTIGVTDGDVVHLYHGAKADRRYQERVAYLSDHDFDPAADLELDHNGLWRWASDKPKMHRAVRRYFDLRKDDGARDDDGAARPVRAWAVGVTTAPRREPTLRDTLRSLAAAGFEDVRVFAEPRSEAPAEFAGLPRTDRGETLGAFPNFYLALSELVLREPRADAYFLCQDDAEFSAHLRTYLEKTLWPAAEVGAVSVYTPSHDDPPDSPRGWAAVDRGWKCWGALGLIFPNASARAFLSDPAVLDHRGFGPKDGLANVDSVVGAWCRRSGRPYFVHRPSLCRHTGETSTLWPAARRATGRRQCGAFLKSAA